MENVVECNVAPLWQAAHKLRSSHEGATVLAVRLNVWYTVAWTLAGHNHGAKFVASNFWYIKPALMTD